MQSRSTVHGVRLLVFPISSFLQYFHLKRNSKVHLILQKVLPLHFNNFGFNRHLTSFSFLLVHILKGTHHCV